MDDMASMRERELWVGRRAGRASRRAKVGAGCLGHLARWSPGALPAAIAANRRRSSSGVHGSEQTRTQEVCGADKHEDKCQEIERKYDWFRVLGPSPPQPAPLIMQPRPRLQPLIHLVSEPRDSDILPEPGLLVV